MSFIPHGKSDLMNFGSKEAYMAFSRRDFIKTGVGTALATGGRVMQAQTAQQATSASSAPADRMPEIPADKMTPEQKKAADEFQAERKVPIFGPFVPLLRSPEVMQRARAMGDYLRYKSVLPPALNEFAILITARRWSQNYIWTVHQPIAVKAGLKAEIAQALAEGRRPEAMSSDEELVYEFSTELHQNQSVSDATYARAVTRLGEQGLIDLIGVNGYYTFLAMVLNTTRTAVPKNAPTLTPFPR
jgi:4-carboxymuconolactone decarboxylase